MTDDQEIRIFEDGDQWCALRGPDLHEGESGFGATPEEALMNLKGHVATALRAQPKCTLRLYVDVIDECGNCPAYRRSVGDQPYCVKTGGKIIPGSDWAGTPTWCPLIRIFPDGDQWCALRGPDLHEGESGFGATPEEALMNLIGQTDAAGVSE